MENEAGTHSILYVDDEPQNLNLFRSLFEQEYTVHTAESGSEALRILGESDIHVLLADQRMPGIDGIQLLERVARAYPETLRVLVTGYSDIDVVIDAINRGSVYHYLRKPWDVEEVQATIRNALEVHGLRRNNQKLIASLDKQNRLLRKKIAELDFLNKLQLELRGLSDSESITDKAILRLQKEIGADIGCYCESRSGTVQIRFPRLGSDREAELGGLIDRLDLPLIETPFSRSMPDGRSLCILPLVSQGTSFGQLVFFSRREHPST
jgi:response regulator RpfG family c-di-GMP phosphodiesterase